MYASIGHEALVSRGMMTYATTSTVDRSGNMVTHEKRLEWDARDEDDEDEDQVKEEGEERDKKKRMIMEEEEELMALRLGRIQAGDRKRGTKK
jgi:hypothetical protein